MTRRVLVIAGGPDAEHEVSLASAEGVCRAIAETYDWLPVRFDLPRDMDEGDLDDLARTVQRDRIEVVFPVLHGTWGEGGGAQTVLELLGVPYVGADPKAAALGMDKARMKALLGREGWPTPPSAIIEAGRPLPLAPPLVLKPINDGSSLDLAICRDGAAVTEARARLHARRGALLAERYVAGRELTVGLLDGTPLPIIEIVPAVSFYDYDAKYGRDDTEYRLDPDLPAGMAERMNDIARAAWRLCGARDLARVDFMLDEDGPWFLEINTMPGFTSHSLLPMAAVHAGLELPELCAHLLELAAARADTAPAFDPA